MLELLRFVESNFGTESAPRPRRKRIIAYASTADVSLEGPHLPTSTDQRLTLDL